MQEVQFVEFQKRDSWEHGFIRPTIIVLALSLLNWRTIELLLALHGVQQVGQHKFRLVVGCHLILNISIMRITYNWSYMSIVRPCMHLNYGVISGSHACRDCGWHIILVAELYTTCPGERVLVATKFNVTCLPLRLCYVNTSTCFSKDAENLTTYGYVLWCSQIACTRHYSLNTIIAFYSVIEWSNFAVSVWSMACQATALSHFT